MKHISDEMYSAAAGMSNVLFNAKQNTMIPADWRQNFENAQKTWDAAVDAHREKLATVRKSKGKK